MCFSQYFNMCTWINSIKTLCFGRKKSSKNCAWSKVFLSHFYKVLLKQMCFNQYFNMCMETFYQNKVFLAKKICHRTVLLKQMCFSQYFYIVLHVINVYQSTLCNMCIETFYSKNCAWLKVFLFTFFINVLPK